MKYEPSKMRAGQDSTTENFFAEPKLAASMYS